MYAITYDNYFIQSLRVLFQHNIQMILTTQAKFLRDIANIRDLNDCICRNFQCKIAVDTGDCTYSRTFYRDICTDNRFTMLVFNNTCDFFILINLLNFLFFCRQDNLPVYHRITNIRTGKHRFQNFEYIAFLCHDRNFPIQVDMFNIKEEGEVGLFLDFIQHFFYRLVPHLQIYSRLLGIAVCRLRQTDGTY